MGLNAVVYVNRKRLSLNQEDNSSAKMDEQTGEVYFDDPNLMDKYPANMFTAIHKRLGNANMIAEIVDKLSTILSKDSILLSKILYSGSHSGDTISIDSLNKLGLEINFVRERIPKDRSPLLDVFFNDITELIEMARMQGNPIVFI